MLLDTLKATIRDLVIAGRGILAADESVGTCTKRFEKLGIDPSEENRRAYREMLFTAPHLEKYVSGVILFDETLRQSTAAGVPFAKLLADKGIVPGIKVDKGVQPLPFSSNETYTQGLDDLPARLQDYKKLGARFAKWRGVLSITDNYPSPTCIAANAEGLANYAAICQANGIVPIVEPELLMDGTHTLERSLIATEKTLHKVFSCLYRHGVMLEYMILKPSMVISGNECQVPASVSEVAEATLQVLRRTVPAAVPSVNFLSGGQSDDLAVAHLEAMNQSSLLKPWNLSFSYGRALQAPALKAWAGKAAHVKDAQKLLIERAEANSKASIARPKHV